MSYKDITIKLINRMFWTFCFVVFLFVIFSSGSTIAQSKDSLMKASSTPVAVKEMKKLNNIQNSFELKDRSEQEVFSFGEIPKLDIEIKKKRSGFKKIKFFFKNLISDEFKNAKIETFVKRDGVVQDNIKLNVRRKKGKFDLSIKNTKNLKPGKYKIILKLEDNNLTEGKEVVFTQNFSWGVLAMNTNKAVYNKNEMAFLQFAVLDEHGDTICDADLEVEINYPGFGKDELTTLNGDIIKNKNCGRNNVLDEPDYYLHYKLKKNGKYNIKVKAKTDNGEYNISDTILVEKKVDFEIERIGPTRIFPKADYDMELVIKANKDYQGEIIDEVPTGFHIYKASLNGDILDDDNYEYRLENNRKLLVWKNLDLHIGDEIKLHYYFDAPNVAPEFYLLGGLRIGDYKEKKQWQIASDAVGVGVAWMTATTTSYGTDLNQASSYPLIWDSQDFDSTKYDYSASNPSQIKIEEDGDYLIALTLPLYRNDTNNYRTRIEAEFRVNGSKKDVGVARSSYIRNAGNHDESSDNMTVLLENLNKGDYVEIYVKGITKARAGQGVYIRDQASVFLEKIESSETVFSGVATQTTDSTDLSTTTAFELEWTERREDTGFTHSDTTNSEDITLDSVGDYLVFVNIPLYSTTARANVTANILLDGTAISGGTFQQGYVRNLDNDSHSSIHWSGVVQSISNNQILSVSTIEDGIAGTVTVNGEKATIYVEKLDSENIYYGRGTNLDVGTDWNDPTPRNILWENDDIIDTNIYTHSTSANQHQITVSKAGDYLVAYNDAMTAGSGRPSNMIELRVNGNPVSGAQTNSHYIRNADAQSSASLTYLLTDLSVNDVITVTTKESGDGDVVNDMDDAVLFIRYIDDKIPPVGNFASANQKTNGSGLIDISFEAVDGNNDNQTAKIEYVAGLSCDFSSSLDPTISTTDASTTATFGDPDVSNTSEYQIGNPTNEILTDSGMNTVYFNWESKTDIPSADGVYCLGLTLQDATGATSSFATTTVTIDNVAPSISNATIENLQFAIGDTLTATITVASDTDTYTLGNTTINGIVASNLQKINNTTYTLDYTVVSGNTDRTSDNIPYSIILLDSKGNANTSFTGNFSGGSIDAHEPSISSIGITNSMFAIGDTITATINVVSDTDIYSLGASTINGVTASNLQKINDTTYTMDYTVTEGDTNRASSTIPYSVVLIDSYGNENTAFSGNFSNGSLDASRPVISSVYLTNGNYGIGDSLKIVIDADEAGYSDFNVTVNGKTISSYLDNGDSTYDAYYQIVEGDTDRTANTIPVSIVLADKYGNTNSPVFTSPSANSATVDAHKPEILSISLSDTVYKIGDTITATVSVTADTNTYTLGTTTINAVTASNLVKVNDSTYTFDINVSEGDIDRSAGTIPVSVMFKDQIGQYNDPAFTTVSANTASIDATYPSIASISFLPSSGILTIGEIATATISLTGSETGATINSATINGSDISGTFAELGGGDYRLVYTVIEGNNDHPDNDDLPVNIVMVDSSGNQASAYTATDPTNRPGVDANRPNISDVSFNITSGLLKVGDTATATIQSDDIGYSAGTMTINGVDVSASLVDNGDNSYSVIYTVAEGNTDIDDASDLPISISLIDIPGNISSAYTTADASNRPGVDANTPSITAVSFSPSSGVLKVGDIATATISVSNAEAGLQAGTTMTVNGVNVQGTFTDIGGGDYTVTYTIIEGNTDIADTSDLPINFNIQDTAGNISSAYTTADASNRPGVDANTPSISSVSFSPSSGLLKIGDIATATISVSNAEAGLQAGTTMTVNGVNVQGTFTDIGGGDYTIAYTVAEGNTDIADTSDLPINFNIQDTAGNISSAYTTADASNRPGVDANKPNISTVSFSPSSGLLKIGDTATATLTTIETNCSVNTAIINGVDVSASFIDNNDNSYSFTYTVQSGNTDISDASDLPVNFTLVDQAGNQGNSFSTADASNRPGVDANNPTSPGNLSFVSMTNGSITLAFGSVSTESNFSEYIIYYKTGTSGVGESDLSWDSSNDVNLGNINYNSVANTTITGLSTSTDYVFNIYAYDTAGNKSSATEITAKTNSYPDLPGSLEQYKSDGTTAITDNTWIDEQSLVFTASSSDDNSEDNLDLYFEIASSSASFTSSNVVPSSYCTEGTNYNNCSSKIWKKSAPEGEWYDTDWLYRKKITINANQINSTENNFVVLATTTDAGLRDYAREDGFDIVFTTSDGATKLDYERESYDSTTGELVAWIKTDVSASADTIIYMYYGNSGENTDNATTTAVWDSDYRGVWHMNNISGGLVQDSTSNGNNMTADSSMNASSLVNGPVGKAIIFDGTDDELTNTSPSGYTAPSDYTMSAWFYYTSDPSGYDNIYSHTTSGGNYDPQWAFNNTAVTIYDGSAISFGDYSGGSGTWHKIDFIRTGDTGSNVVTYIDGVQFGTAQAHNDDILVPTTLYIGASSLDGELWTGSLDEIRYSESARSVNWIQTEYNNQSDVDSFMTIGSQVEQVTNIAIDQFPEFAEGYKWQAMSCDQMNACSPWQSFNTTIPNFKIDLAAPTAPGKLIASTINNTDIVFNFGATTTEGNFQEYRIYYKIGSSSVSESDSLFASTSDANLADILYNGAATTNITNLTAATQYSFAIWAYDLAGNKASSSVSVYTTTGGGNAPTGLFNSVAEKTNGSGVVDISVEIDDADNNDQVRAKLEYVAGASCDFTTPLDPTLDENASNISADYGSPIITNANPYQIGTSSGWILTSPGSNTINFDWNTQTDIPTANGVYCLRLTANDADRDQLVSATTTILIDNTSPTAPGNLTLNSALTNSAVLNFGSSASDSNFANYKIYYKLGDSAVSPVDNEHSDANMSFVNYNGAATTTLTGLASGVKYVINIYAYDDYGNYSSASEITAITNYTPDEPISLQQQKIDGSAIANGELIDESDIKLTASTTDVNAGETVTFYYELLENGASFTSSASVPASFCLDGADYNSCSSKIWAASTTTGVNPADWYNSNWLYRKKITIDATKVVANETGFVSLVKITDSDLAGKVRSDGYDIVFTDSSGTKLDYEREYIHSSTGELVAWVKTDISSTTDTILYLYYGNGNASTDNATTTAVWDLNYKGVWHLNNDPTGTIYDSTANANNMTSAGAMTSDDVVSGQVGRALDFDGSNDYISTLSPNNYGTPGDYTVTAWFYNSAQTGYSNFYSHTTSNSDYDPQWTFNNSTVTVYDGSAITLGTYSADNAWHRIDFVRSGTTVTAYIDGISNGSGTHSDDLLVPTEVYIGNSGSSRTEYWSGPLDEIRYSETARSVNLIRTEYNNQNSPSTFMSFDSEEVYKYFYGQGLKINSLPDSNNGYKWQVLACDDDNACSAWKSFNASTPNIKIDANGPSAPGNLSVSSQTAGSITLNFGTSSVDNNFKEYKIFYKLGNSGVTELDSLQASNTDANLAYLDYNGASNTTINGLSAGSEYVFNIWAYDILGRKASATIELVASTNYTPVATFTHASEKTDGTGVVDISINADDGNNDDLVAKLEYVSGSTCDFSSPLDPTLDETDANATSTYLDAKIVNADDYQIGSSTGFISTASGANTVNFDWLSATDIPSADGVYCLRLTANDLVDDQAVPATTTLTIDNTAPTAPGDLTLESSTGNSITLNFGATTTETNFVRYKIFYKVGVATVNENDFEHTDSDLNDILFNGTATTTISGLNFDTQYSFKIFAYDAYGNKSSSEQTTFTTNAPPTGIFNSVAQKTDGSGVVDVSIEVYDTNLDDVTAKLEYVSGSACDFSTPLDPTLDESSANITSDHGTTTILNSASYQIGAGADVITTSDGSNTINFDWLANADIGGLEGVYCLRLTTNDGQNDQTVLATSSFFYDDVDPTAPASLSIGTVTGINVGLNFGTAGSDSSFKEYKIFYKQGTSGVTESDNEFNKNDDSNLGSEDFNSASQTTVSSLNQNADYVFNIWIYDDYGNKASAPSEVSTTTLVIPSATWREEEDTKDPTVGTNLGRDEKIRLRLAIANTRDWDIVGYNFDLEYGLINGTCKAVNTWTTIPTTPTTEHFEMIDSNYFSNLSSTTARLVNVEGYNFEPGYILESPSSKTPGQNLSAGSYTELEFTIDPTINAIAGQRYCFRTTNNGELLDNYAVYPEFTLAPAPKALFVSAAQKTDGTEAVDISMDVIDVNGDNTSVKVEYVQGAGCDFTTPLDPTLDEASENISADFGTPAIDNNATFQIGTTTGWITTSYGTNTVNVDWDALADLSNADDTYCLRLTATDNLDEQTNPATTTVVLDHIAPTTPGNLEVADITSNSVKLFMGTSSIDTNFKEYKIFYKEGISGVTESDSLWASSSDVNLGVFNWNGATTTEVTGLEVNKQYVFNIWAYDKFGHKAVAANEVSASIRYVSVSENWHFYADQQHETPTTTLASENVAPIDVTDGAVIKLRLALREIENITGENIKIRLEYSPFSDFSADVNFVGERGSTTALWTYGDGIDLDNDLISKALLSGVSSGATHNESGISTTSYDHLGGTVAEWEFTIKANGALSGNTYYFRAYDNSNKTAIAKSGSYDYPSILISSPNLNYTVGGYSSGASVEGVLTTVDSSFNNIDFGSLAIDDDKVAAQKFTVNTNAGGGYQLFVYQRQNLISGNGADIDAVPYTNDSPGAWPINPDPSAFGYHTGDDTLSGNSPSRFSADNTYAAFETSSEEVSYSQIPVENEEVNFIYRIEAGNMQEAGDYETEIVYILLPTFDE